MSTELRYVERCIPVDGYYCKNTNILQFRSTYQSYIDCGPDSIKTERWSEWTDVPVVIEEEL